MLRLFLTLLILSAFGTVVAQSRISGTISGISAVPLPLVVVTLKQTSASITVAAQTDSLGAFYFNDLSNGSYTLTASHVSYKTHELHFELHQDTTFTIQLEQSIEQLHQVEVTGTRAAIDRTGDKVVYNIGSSVTAAGSDALQAISQIPGVRVNGDEITVVGRGATRVMLNNRLIQLQGQDLTRYLKSLSANQILRLELITNPSARYEVEGNAGLINIITKHSTLKGYSGNVQLASKYYLYGVPAVYGKRTFGELSGSGNLAYKWNRLSAYASFNHVRDQHLEGFQFDLFYPGQHWLQTDTGLYTHTAYTGLIGVDYKLSTAVNIGASYSGGWDMYDGSDQVRNPIFNQTGTVDSLLSTYAHYHPIAQPAAWNLHSEVKLDTTGKQLSVNADYFNYYRNDVSDFESNSFDAAGNQKPDGTTRIFDRNKQNIRIYTLKADVDWPTRFATYSFGGKLSYITEYSNAFYYDKTTGGDLLYNTGLSNEFNYTENTQAVYGSMNKDLNAWKFQAELRGELTQTKGSSYTVQKTTTNAYFKVFPSLLVNYAVNQSNTLSLALGRRINRPSFWSLNPFKSLYTAYSYGEGNPYLQPEYNSNLELTHAYKSLFRTSVFANKTDNGFVNVTITDPDTNFVRTIPLNFIRTTRVGASENVSFKPFPWWETNVLVSVYYTTAHSSLLSIKSLDGTGAYLSSANNLYFNQSKTVGAAVNFWYQFPEVDHIGRTDRYYKLDLGVKATTSNKKWDAALNLNDVFRSSALAYSYTVNNVPQRFTNFQIIRYFQLSVTYRFGSSSEASSTKTAGNEEERGRVH